LVTSVRGIGLAPTTSESAALGVIGFMKAAFGLRAVFFVAVFFAILSPYAKTQDAKMQRSKDLKI
jgi:hypothetical protein